MNEKFQICINQAMLTANRMGRSVFVRQQPDGRWTRQDTQTTHGVYIEIECDGEAKIVFVDGSSSVQGIK